MAPSSRTSAQRTAPPTKLRYSSGEENEDLEDQDELLDATQLDWRSFQARLIQQEAEMDFGSVDYSRFDENFQDSHVHEEEEVLDDWRAFRAKLVKSEAVMYQDDGLQEDIYDDCDPMSGECDLDGIGEVFFEKMAMKAALRKMMEPEVSSRWAYESGTVIEQGTVVLGGTEQDFGFGLRQQYFHKAAILVVDHQETSFTKGIILNRPTDLELVDDLNPGVRWRVWFGGDVQGIESDNPDIVCLHSIKSSQAKRASVPVMNDIQWTTFENAKRLVKAGVASPEDFQVFCGYAGWGPGQLSEEVNRKSWYNVAADPQTILSEMATQASSDPRDAGLETWSLLMKMIGRDSMALHREGGFDDLMLKEWSLQHLLSNEGGGAAGTRTRDLSGGYASYTPNTNQRADPYTNHHADPYSNHHADPYANHRADPFANNHADPFVNHRADPFANNHADPFANNHADPFANNHADPWGDYHRRDPFEQMMNRNAYASQGQSVLPGHIVRSTSAARSPFLLDDQELHKSVILVLSDDEKLTVGVILNRPAAKGVDIQVSRKDIGRSDIHTVPLRFGGQYAVQGEDPMTWVHCSDVLRRAGFGSPIGEANNGVWKCTAEEVTMAISQGFATVEDFFVITGVSVWSKENGSRGMQGEIESGRFEIIPSTQTQAVWDSLSRQQVLNEWNLHENLAIADESWSRGQVYSNGYLPYIHDRTGNIHQDDALVFKSNVKVSTLADDALKNWVATFLLGVPTLTGES